MCEQTQELFKGTAEEMKALKDYLETIRECRQMSKKSNVKGKVFVTVSGNYVSIETTFYGGKKSSKE